MVAQRPYEDIRLEGHLIDSLMASRVMDDIMDMEGEFEILSFDVGRTKTDTSAAVLRVFGRDQAHLEQMLRAVQEHGATAVMPEDAELAPAPTEGVFPEDFYSTTNLSTYVRLAGQWIPVADPEMDCGILVDAQERAARTMPVGDVTKGGLFVVGRKGVRVIPLARPRERQPFEFMGSAVSSEKPKAQVIHEIARLLKEARDKGEETIAVVGPAVVHTGAVDHLARMVARGHVSVLFGGNAIAVHDIEAALYGTSLGVSLAEGTPVHGGHEHHLRAINTIRGAGGIARAVEQGVLTSGLMYTCVKSGTPFVLAGSIRDDGPLPDVITDAIEAQRAMRVYARRAGVCLMLSTMLHSIAVGNMLPATARSVCVDINPAVATKLADRGSFQAMGIVTDVGLFLEQLADELDEH